MKNPTWNREELVLALDLYFKLEYGQMDGRHPEVIALSRLLTLMNEENGFDRSINSISLKLANFKRIDPGFKGKGMRGGSKLEENIWNEFAHNKFGLTEEAEKLRADIITKTIEGRKGKFAAWLKRVGKSDGSDYELKTVQIYSAQVEKAILKEFSIEVEDEIGLYGITDLQELQRLEKKLAQGKDNKKRRDLRSAFRGYIRFIRDEYELNDLAKLPEEFNSKTEGGKKVYVSQRAERDSGLRNKAIAIHGTTCQVCGFDFGQQYGEWGEGFIEVHHLTPLGGDKSAVRDTDPGKDLTVLCANCHRMVHRKKKMVLSIEELKQKIRLALA